ncbi:NUDIX hydrolase [Martelella endophytica]|uniref:Membrane protein n=1 Tax=Martelella endophytica TaxID=1486262 RepID=A0A0D5LMY3_MAREN|nr:membrane protein [Martelella endophytica]AJY45315.1 membrane protein [Martelella endophytica]
MAESLAHAELIAVLTALTDDAPRVMTVRMGAALPSGPFESGHPTLQTGLRSWVESQTGHPVGYLEQLYTFADRDRGIDTRTISISYLGLVREQSPPGSGGPLWKDWYTYFPWEDLRAGRPEILDQVTDMLTQWAMSERPGRAERRHRLDFAFGLNGMVWNEELVLQRFELMHEAGLIAEAGLAPAFWFGRPMAADHRRILATGIARLRSKIKYRPVLFELMPESFTLLQLQKGVEALAGLRLHKPNFRRQIDQQQLIEETGETSAKAGGRPAKLFRYRHAIVEERALSGSRFPVART